MKVPIRRCGFEEMDGGELWWITVENFCFCFCVFFFRDTITERIVDFHRAGFKKGMKQFFLDKMG